MKKLFIPMLLCLMACKEPEKEPLKVIGSIRLDSTKVPYFRTGQIDSIDLYYQKGLYINKKFDYSADMFIKSLENRDTDKMIYWHIKCKRFNREFAINHESTKNQIEQLSEVSEIAIINVIELPKKDADSFYYTQPLINK